MTNDEMIDTGKMLLDFEHEDRIIQKKIDALLIAQKERRSCANKMRDLLVKTIDIATQEKIIVIGTQAIILTYNSNGNRLRISHNAIASDA